MKITTGIIVSFVIAFVVLVAAMVTLAIFGFNVGDFVAQIGLLLTAIGGFITILLGMQKQNSSIETIKGNTNGTLTKIQDNYESAMVKLNAALALLPHDAAQNVLDVTVSKDEANSLVSSVVSTPPTATAPNA